MLLSAIFFELPITRTPANSNFFRFPLKVRVIGSRLYCRRHFVCSYFARRPREKYARLSHGLTQVVAKKAHLAISMEPTPLLEKVSSCGLLPRLWLLLTAHWASIQSTFFDHFSAFNKYNFSFF